MPIQFYRLFKNSISLAKSVSGEDSQALEGEDYNAVAVLSRSPTLVSDSNSSCSDSDIDSIDFNSNLPTLHIEPFFKCTSGLDLPEKIISHSPTELSSGYMSDSEFWSSLIEDYSDMLTRHRDRVSQKVYQGIPEICRGHVWQSMSQSRTTYLDTLYLQLLDESSPFEADILLDLPRTFPRIEIFQKKDEGQTRLFNVLKAYSVYDPEIGYAQGLSYIVAVLLIHMSENEAFNVFVRLMQSQDLREVFLLDLKNLECRIYQFRCLLSNHFPKLVRHLDAYNVRTAMYTTSWFLTLFTNLLPLPLIFRLLDVMLLEGITVTVMRMGLALMFQHSEELSNLKDYGDIMEVLTRTMFEVASNREEELIQSIRLFDDVNEKALSILSKRYKLLRNVFAKK